MCNTGYSTSTLTKLENEWLGVPDEDIEKFRSQRRSHPEFRHYMTPLQASSGIKRATGEVIICTYAPDR